MNTTPTTFKSNPIPYTVVGENKPKTDSGKSLTILLLNRGGRFYRDELFKDITAMKFADIIYIEGPELSYDIEPLSRKYPDVRFLLLKDRISDGEKINLGFHEAFTNYILVMWSDMKLDQSRFTEKYFKGITAEGALCFTPVLKNHKKEVIPTVQVPGFIKKRVKIVPWLSEEEGIRTVFAFDFCGLYNKKSFDALGGFDGTIANPYWQKLDFGFRAYLWGYELSLAPRFILTYTLDFLTEDSTPDESYKRFYLKNIAIRHKKDRCILKLYKYITYVLKSDTGPFHSFKDFMEARRWVKENQFKFKTDIKKLIAGWKPPEL